MSTERDDREAPGTTKAWEPGAPLTVTALVRAAHATAVEKGWHDKERSLGEAVALMHSELSEALECLRSHGPMTKWYRQEDGKPEGFAVELADTVIRIADTCGALGIDLEDALIEKLIFNRSRPYRHGYKNL